MFETEKARLEALREKFDKAREGRTPAARSLGREYLDALDAFLEAFRHGPASDPRLERLDTTGTASRDEEYAAWVQDEQRRVRHALADVP